MTSTSSRPALRLAAAAGVDLAAAIDAFLSQPDLAPTTRAKYRQTLAVVEDELGDAPVTGTGLAGVVEQRWHHASPATWNRHVATVRSFAHYCTRTRIATRRRGRSLLVRTESDRRSQQTLAQVADPGVLRANTLVLLSFRDFAPLRTTRSSSPTSARQRRSLAL